ncbi:hypothetical protein D3C86_2044570 [compost metagenome]
MRRAARGIAKPRRVRQSAGVAWPAACALWPDTRRGKADQEPGPSCPATCREQTGFPLIHPKWQGRLAAYVNPRGALPTPSIRSTT